MSAPVVGIVGGGPVGLTLYALLARYGVPSILFERQSGLSTHPQGHFISARTMEIFRHGLGHVDARVRQAGPPPSDWRDFVMCSTLRGREFARVDNMTGQQAALMSRLSSVGCAHLSQSSLSPILLEEAHRLGANGPGQIVFDANVESIQEEEDGATVTVRRAGGKEVHSLNFRYVVAADGPQSHCREAMGIRCRGDPELGHVVNIHFSSPELGRHLRGRPGMLYFVYNEEVVCVMVAHDVHRGEWACQIPFFAPWQDHTLFCQSFARECVKQAIGGIAGGVGGAEDIAFDIRSVQPWTMRSLVAEAFQSKNKHVFLAGDAAHQFPPAGGFGMNTGIHDVFNLAWKLALATKGASHERLLQTYGEERRPVAEATADLSVRNYKRSLRMARALGLDPEHPRLLFQSPFGMALRGKGARERTEALLALGRKPLACLRETGNPYGDARVRDLHEVLAAGAGLPLLFPEHDLCMAYGPQDQRDSGNTAVEPPESQIRVGGRMPHFGTLRSADDNRLSLSSSVDLPAQLQSLNFSPKSTGKMHVVLLTRQTGGTSCTFWQEALAQPFPGKSFVEVVHIPIRTRDQGDGCYDCLLLLQAMERQQVSAVFVRPDGHVGWLCPEIPAHAVGPTSTTNIDLLHEALTACLAIH